MSISTTPSCSGSRWCADRQRGVERPPQLANLALVGSVELASGAVLHVHLYLHQQQLGFGASRSLAGGINTMEGVNCDVQGHRLLPWPWCSAERTPNIAGLVEHLVALAADGMLAHRADGSLARPGPRKGLEAHGARCMLLDSVEGHRASDYIGCNRVIIKQVWNSERDAETE